MTKLFSARRKEIYRATTKLATEIADYMASKNVSILSLVVADVDGVYSVCDGDDMFRVGAVVVAKDIKGERWIGIIDWEDIFSNDNLSFLETEKTKPTEFVDSFSTLDSKEQPDWYRDYVQCIDDTCMFPIDTYTQISEAVEQALAD